MTNETVLSVKKLKTKYKVETTENKYSFSEDTIIKYSIFKGKSFNNKELELILEEENKNSLLNKTINYLSYQARSIGEVKKYLLDKECSPNLANEIIDKLISLGYLNDESLTNSLLDYVIRSKKGPKFLEEKLLTKGISEDLIKEVLDKYTEELEEEVLVELLDKITFKYKSYPVKKQKLLLYQKLLRDGFSSEVVNRLINKLKFIDESNDVLIKEIKKLLNKYDEIDYQVRNKIISKLMNKGYEYANIIECLENLEY